MGRSGIAGMADYDVVVAARSASVALGNLPFVQLSPERILVSVKRYVRIVFFIELLQSHSSSRFSVREVVTG